MSLDLFKNTDNIYDERVYLAFLATKVNLTISRTREILDIYPDFQSAFDDNLITIKHNLQNPKWLDKKLDFSDLDNYLEKLKKENIQILTYFDEDYPDSLEDLVSPPVVFYYRGNLKNLKIPDILTVVGSRNISNYGEILLEKILAPVCRLGIGVVSGLALGVDVKAHLVALQNQAPTIAVVGSGLDKSSFYPSSNFSVVNQILENDGLILSEYNIGVMPSRFTFPARNRILAALSKFTWVVEATEKSGSLITAKNAKDLGRILGTSPGHILENNLQGNLNLLKNGAKIITNPQDILDILKISTSVESSVISSQNIEFNSKEEEKIHNLLTLSEQNLDILAEKSGLNITELQTNLSLLELNGLAKHLGGNNWVRN
jgi:DNA processing protein